jgi:formylglycine-generating enzyme required for sulfatase activity
MKKLFVLVTVLTLAFSAHAADQRSVAVKGKPAATKERKTALVIGNSTYLSSPLKNPANDARAMAKALRALGFTVDERTNLNQIEMKQAVEVFGQKIKEGGVGLFYYAGHGMQVNGRNYLIPVDADIQGEAEVDYKAVDAGLVLAKMDMAKNDMNIVVLDACRNNPFARSFRSPNLGLATMNAPSGTLIAYATSPGSVASDGKGANGLYTQEVVKAIMKPGLKIEDAFKQVRSGVQNQTNGKQVPWESSSLVGDFYFAGKPEGGVDTSRLQGLAEGSKERQAELERLKKLEADAVKQKAKEQAEIAKKEKELAALDAQIATMKGKLGSGTAGPDDSLEKMVAMIEKKEADARKLEELRKQREAEEAKRQAEIVRLKKEAEATRKAEIEKDIANFEKIAGSAYGKDMMPTAWKSLTTKYASADGIENIEVGNVRALRSALIYPMYPMDFVLVKGGCYQMGDGNANAVHEVCVDDFYIGKYEVTQAQWSAIRGNNPSYSSNCGDNCPVEQVSWNDIQEFIRELSQQTGKTYRLPTEAEWEYAAQSGGKSEKYAGTSSEAELGDYAWYDKNSGSKTHPVGQKKPNGLGIYDMTGNVWEWCSDWYDESYYKNSPKDNPQGPSNGSARVLRGGSWYGYAWTTQASYRNSVLPYGRYGYLGFRLARTR